MSQGLRQEALSFNEAADLLWNTLKTAMGTLVEEKTILSRETSSWYILEHSRAKRKRDEAYHHFIRSNSGYDWTKYTRLRNTCSRNLKTTRRNDFSGEISKHKGNSKELRQVLKSLLR